MKSFQNSLVIRKTFPLFIIRSRYYYPNKTKSLTAGKKFAKIINLIKNSRNSFGSYFSMVRFKLLNIIQRGKIVTTFDKYNKKNIVFKPKSENNLISRLYLPINDYRSIIIRIIKKYSSVVLIGKTGSGKTSQIPKIILNHTYRSNSLIICTQPRRVATVSAAKRLALEIQKTVGSIVGYKIRYEYICTQLTRLFFITDGILLREALQKNNIKNYSCFMIDEAHERSLNLDICLGILKEIQKISKQLKIIIMSATLEVTSFLAYFSDCYFIKIPGRIHSVSIKWLKNVEKNYFEKILSLILIIHLRNLAGDILIFLSGQDEIETLVCVLKTLECKNSLNTLICLPIYSKMSKRAQMSIFNKCKAFERKCIIATNIAETSLTIGGIRFVVDSGFCKVKYYHPSCMASKLEISLVSKSSAIQRAGRAGRTRKGFCFRLYNEFVFSKLMDDSTMPEIKRLNMSNIIILLKNLKCCLINEFDFLTDPPLSNIQSSLFELWAIGCLDNDGFLTGEGYRIALMNLESKFSKLILNSIRFKCSFEIIVIVSLLQFPRVLVLSATFYKEVNKTMKSLKNCSEIMIFYLMYQEWRKNSYSCNWCLHNSVDFKVFCSVRKMFKFVKNQTIFCHFNIFSCRKAWCQISKTIFTTNLTNLSLRKSRCSFIHFLTGLVCFINKKSIYVDFSYESKFVVYMELIITSIPIILNFIHCELEWIKLYGKKIFIVLKK